MLTSYVALLLAPGPTTSIGHSQRKVRRLSKKPAEPAPRDEDTVYVSTRRKTPIRLPQSPSNVVDADTIVVTRRKTPIRPQPSSPNLEKDGLEIVGSPVKPRPTRPIAGLPARAKAKRAVSNPVPSSSDKGLFSKEVKQEEVEAVIEKLDEDKVPVSQIRSSLPSVPSSSSHVFHHIDDATVSKTTRSPELPPIAPIFQQRLTSSTDYIGDSDGYYHTEPSFGPRRSKVSLPGTSQPEDWILGRHWQHREQVNQDRLSAANWARVSPTYVRLLIQSSLCCSLFWSPVID